MTTREALAKGLVALREGLAALAVEEAQLDLEVKRELVSGRDPDELALLVADLQSRVETARAVVGLYRKVVTDPDGRIGGSSA